MRQKILLVFIIFLLLPSFVMSHDVKPNTLLEAIDFSTLKFQNGEKEVLWNDLFKKEKPLIFFLIYYKCPSVCNNQLNSFFKSVKDLGLEPGKDFELVVLSFDHNENSELAQKKKNAYIQEFQKDGKNVDFHFLNGSKENIEKITVALKFSYFWNEKENQWVHPVGAYIYSKEGIFFRKIGGAVFDPKTIYFSLAEIHPSILKNFWDKTRLYFSKYEQITGDYKINVDRIFNILIPVLLLISGMVIFTKLFKIFNSKKYNNG